jgi:hypothetical protein
MLISQINAGGGMIISNQSLPPEIGSLQFSSASAQYLTVPANDNFNFGQYNFTIEFWAYPTNIAAGTGDMFVMENGNAYMIIGQSNTDGRVRINWNDTPTTGSPFNSAVSSAGTFVQNTWHHICAMRFGTYYTLFINGVCRATTNGVNGVQMGSAALPWYIGSDAGSNRFNGNISNLRISNALPYLYGTTVGTTYFPPPTSPLTNIGGTTLLLSTTYDSNFLRDSSYNQLILTNTGGVISSALRPFN